MSIISDNKYLGPYELGRAAIVRSLVPSGRGRRALDLGCGCGFFSQILVEKGWQVTAVDVERKNVAKARRFAQDTIVGDAVSALGQLRENSFELVLVLELIEHLSDGKGLLEGLRRVTGKDGQLIISTPNRMSPEGLGGYYWGEKVRKWGKWCAWDNTHVRIYSSFELMRLLHGSGWKVRKQVGFWYRGTLPFGIRWSVGIESSGVFPLNRFGFNVIAVCAPLGR